MPGGAAKEKPKINYNNKSGEKNNENRNQKGRNANRRKTFKMKMSETEVKLLKEFSEIATSETLASPYNKIDYMYLINTINRYYRQNIIEQLLLSSKNNDYNNVFIAFQIIYMIIKRTSNKYNYLHPYKLTQLRDLRKILYLQGYNNIVIGGYITGLQFPLVIEQNFSSNLIFTNITLVKKQEIPIYKYSKFMMSDFDDFKFKINLRLKNFPIVSINRSGNVLISSLANNGKTSNSKTFIGEYFSHSFEDIFLSHKDKASLDLNLYEKIKLNVKLFREQVNADLLPTFNCRRLMKFSNRVYLTQDYTYFIRLDSKDKKMENLYFILDLQNRGQFDKIGTYFGNIHEWFGFFWDEKKLYQKSISKLDYDNLRYYLKQHTAETVNLFFDKSIEYKPIKPILDKMRDNRINDNFFKNYVLHGFKKEDFNDFPSKIPESKFKKSGLLTVDVAYPFVTKLKNKLEEKFKKILQISEKTKISKISKISSLFTEILVKFEKTNLYYNLNDIDINITLNNNSEKRYFIIPFLNFNNKEHLQTQYGGERTTLKSFKGLRQIGGTVKTTVNSGKSLFSKKDSSNTQNSYNIVELNHEYIHFDNLEEFIDTIENLNQKKPKDSKGKEIIKEGLFQYKRYYEENKKVKKLVSLDVNNLDNKTINNIFITLILSFIKNYIQKNELETYIPKTFLYFHGFIHYVQKSYFTFYTKGLIDYQNLNIEFAENKEDILTKLRTSITYLNNFGVLHLGLFEDVLLYSEKEKDIKIENFNNSYFSIEKFIMANEQSQSQSQSELTVEIDKRILTNIIEKIKKQKNQKEYEELVKNIETLLKQKGKIKYKDLQNIDNDMINILFPHLKSKTASNSGLLASGDGDALGLYETTSPDASGPYEDLVSDGDLFTYMGFEFYQQKYKEINEIDQNGKKYLKPLYPPRWHKNSCFLDHIIFLLFFRPNKYIFEKIFEESIDHIFINNKSKKITYQEVSKYDRKDITYETDETYETEIKARIKIIRDLLIYFLNKMYNIKFSEWNIDEIFYNNKNTCLRTALNNIFPKTEGSFFYNNPGDPETKYSYGESHLTLEVIQKLFDFDEIVENNLYNFYFNTKINNYISVDAFNLLDETFVKNEVLEKDITHGFKEFLNRKGQHSYNDCYRKTTQTMNSLDLIVTNTENVKIQYFIESNLLNAYILKKNNVNKFISPYEEETETKIFNMKEIEYSTNNIFQNGGEITVELDIQPENLHLISKLDLISNIKFYNNTEIKYELSSTDFTEIKSGDNNKFIIVIKKLDTDGKNTDGAFKKKKKEFNKISITIKKEKLVNPYKLENGEESEYENFEKCRREDENSFEYKLEIENKRISDNHNNKPLFINIYRKGDMGDTIENKFDFLEKDKIVINNKEYELNGFVNYLDNEKHFTALFKYNDKIYHYNDNRTDLILLTDNIFSRNTKGIVNLIYYPTGNTIVKGGYKKRSIKGMKTYSNKKTKKIN